MECGAEDPVLVVPWHSEEEPERCRFVDLRENPYDLDQIPEAEQHPALMQALRALNAGRSPVFTAKCDVWAMQEEDVAATRQDLDVDAADGASFGYACYLDLVWRDRSLFVSFYGSEQRLVRLSRLLEPVDAPYAAAECVLRPALVDLAGPAEGFAVSLYVKALGADAAQAYDRWGAALAAVVTTMRSREFALGQGERRRGTDTMEKGRGE